MAKAKNNVALGFPGEFETTGDMSRRLEEALVYKLPDDYFAKYVQSIQAVTAAADGCKAAIDAERWLEAEGITEAATATAW